VPDARHARAAIAPALALSANIDHLVDPEHQLLREYLTTVILYFLMKNDARTEPRRCLARYPL
jgi:hypothetical protein